MDVPQGNDAALARAPERRPTLITPRAIAAFGVMSLAVAAVLQFFIGPQVSPGLTYLAVMFALSGVGFLLGALVGEAE